MVIWRNLAPNIGRFFLSIGITIIKMSIQSAILALMIAAVASSISQRFSSQISNDFISVQIFSHCIDCSATDLYSQNREKEEEKKNQILQFI